MKTDTGPADILAQLHVFGRTLRGEQRPAVRLSIEPANAAASDHPWLSRRGCAGCPVTTSPAFLTATVAAKGRVVHTRAALHPPQR